MSKLSYSEKLKHPKWQRKRLEVFKDHEFSCELCDAKDKTLHVHHGYYQRDLQPWEYPVDSLHCLCEDCHKKIQERMDKLNCLIGCLPVSELIDTLGFVCAQHIRYPGVAFEVEAAVLEGMAIGLEVHPAEIQREVQADGMIRFDGLDFAGRIEEWCRAREEKGGVK